MEVLKMIPYVILVIVIAGVIAGAGAITLGNFGDTMTTCWNGSYSAITDHNGSTVACNATTTATHAMGNAGPDTTNLSYEYFTKVQAQEGISTTAEQLPTIAIIAIMVIIISLIAGVFVYMKFFG